VLGISEAYVPPQQGAVSIGFCGPRRDGDASRRGRQGMGAPCTPSLWFDTEAEEAAAFYTSVFENSRIVNVTRYTEAGPRAAGMVMTVEFELDGQRFIAINGGPEFTFDEAVSFQISCETQDDVDYFWDRLSEGGEEGQCGWLTDRFGLSWQVVPTGTEEILSDSDPERAYRVMQALLSMRKIDIAALRSAAERSPSSSQRHAARHDRLADDLAHVPSSGTPTAPNVAHSMTGGEAVRLLTRHGADRVARLALVATTTPKLVQDPGRPRGVPRATLDEMIAALRADKPAYLAANAPAFFGGTGAVSERLLQWDIGRAARASLHTSVELPETLRDADLGDELAGLPVPPPTCSTDG
jgi:predicted 3-demethylubiquinone-9 3-methyltransferase (glyoxalase superfamily)